MLLHIHVGSNEARMSYKCYLIVAKNDVDKWYLGEGDDISWVKTRNAALRFASKKEALLTLSECRNQVGTSFETSLVSVSANASVEQVGAWTVTTDLDAQEKDEREELKQHMQENIVELLLTLRDELDRYEKINSGGNKNDQ
jgi:hypothetical protein